MSDQPMRLAVRSFVGCLGAIGCIAMGVSVDSAAAAPGFACYPVRPGDTAATISLRETQTIRGWREPGFQIFDPVAARFIPKAGYNRIHPGWQVCIVESLLTQSGAQPGRSSGPYGVRVRTPVPSARVATTSTYAPNRVPWGWLPLLLTTPVMVWIIFRRHTDRTKRVTRTLETFAIDFIREFERPLLDERSHEPVLHSEISLYPHSRSMEVRLAPAGGRRYPNLAGHRADVDYDIHRVLTLLDDRRFSCGPVRSHGPWVTFPFRLIVDSHKEGEA